MMIFTYVLIFYRNVSDTDKEKFKRRAERMKEKANIFKVVCLIFIIYNFFLRFSIWENNNLEQYNTTVFT